ncbi:MAG: PVC-type heme-binding CxxCH protein [Verrucomicrobiota bacterium]
MMFQKTAFSPMISAALATGLFASVLALAAEPPPLLGQAVALFDGQTLAGWEGDPRLWRVQDGAITGGSLTEMVRQNEFLATTRDYTNFIVRFKIRLTGTEGFINSGFQIRSQRVPNSSEMAGYQCDFGEPNWYGAIYDESRRNKVMSASDMQALRPVIRPDDWNDYVIRADGSRITTWINGVQGTDFYEPDMSLPRVDSGKLGIQVHGGGKALVQVKEIFIEELPLGNEPFIGAPAPTPFPKNSPLTPAEELATFTLPPGFEIELIASEVIEAGFGKFVAIDWDLQGRLWTMTALEYPVDANENAAVAAELYASRAKDKVLVYERDPASPTGYASKPRVFADGLAIPLGILPWQNGVYVQHGTEIVFLSDTDGDGRADKREVILSGFGVQDSHLFPHQFTRAPGHWIWMAQGAFNYGKVKTSRNVEVQFDQTRMAKFRYDGSAFEITSQGPCNIWGLVLDATGQAWIQEANDFGYPVMPFHEHANYPGCSDAQWKSYAPEFPGTAPEFSMGGTGLSGLALSDAQPFWPAPYVGIFYIANPITRKIQAIRVTPDGPRFRYQKLPDFVLSSDEWFRPVALRVGPDSCLYIVDWYNKIISHNEVPRNHPERDKKRGRIWRVKPARARLADVPDFSRISGEELLAKLGSPVLQQSHLAWQAISDRRLHELAPRLKAMVRDRSQAVSRRLAALWALEGLDAQEPFGKGGYFELLDSLFADSDRNVRREGIRVMGSRPPSIAGAHATWTKVFDALDRAAEDADPLVRAEAIKTAAGWLSFFRLSSDSQTAALPETRVFPLLLRMAKPPLDGPVMKSTLSGRIIKTGAAYEREFERYLVRLFLEKAPGLEEFLASPVAQKFPVENRLVASLALEPRASAVRVAELLPWLERPPGEEELLRLAQSPEAPGVLKSLRLLLRNPVSRHSTAEGLLKVRTRFDASKLKEVFEAAARVLIEIPASVNLGIRWIRGFQLTALEPELADILAKRATAASRTGKELDPEGLAALQALRDLKSDRIELFLELASHNPMAVREAAFAALAASRDPRGAEQLADLFPRLPPEARPSARVALTSTRSGALGLVKLIRTGVIAKEELDSNTLEKMQALLGDHPELNAILAELSAFLRPVLRLDGSEDAWIDTSLTLEGPFTVETWVKLDPGIDNNDSLLGAPGVLDMNFFGGQFRVWVGGGVHDAIVARKKMLPDVWTHISVTRDTHGRWAIYLNGELDQAQGHAVTNRFDQLRLGWSTPARGTAGWFDEFRIWTCARTAEEIRADFDRGYDEPSKPASLAHRFAGMDWGKMRKGASVVRVGDHAALMSSIEAVRLAEKFSAFRKLAEQTGDSAKGKGLFQMLCQSCHSVGGEGGQVGPVLNGAGALGIEALLRNILTPSAAMEPGYRLFRVERVDGEVLDGILVTQDSEAIVLRRPNVEDIRIARGDVRKAEFTRSSMMPEGLLEALPPEEISNLFAYLKSLK